MWLRSLALFFLSQLPLLAAEAPVIPLASQKMLENKLLQLGKSGVISPSKTLMPFALTHFAESGPKTGWRE
jgi:hypothetical protein